MSSVCEALAAIVIWITQASGPSQPIEEMVVDAGMQMAQQVCASRTALRVCADPNNLPFTNRQGEGFENALAELVARNLGRTVEYVWFPQRRGFARNTLRAGRCDVVMGVPTDYEFARVTRPYYRSSYVFITRRDRGLRIRSLDDPRLRTLRIGVHVIGDDYASVPPAQALANRGIFRNIVGYALQGDYSEPNPPADLIRAVAQGEVDVAIAWGPLAGYFAKKSEVPLSVTPLSVEREGVLEFAFDIGMGVRQGDEDMQRLLEGVIHRRRREIRSLLRAHGVPLRPVRDRASTADRGK